MAWRIRHPEVVYTDLEDGAILLHFETKCYYSLNEVGRAIWRMLDSTNRAEEVVQKLMAEYEGEEGQVKEQVSMFLQELEREQLTVPDHGERDERPEETLGESASPAQTRRPFVEPELIKHDEPLHEVVMNPFDPQLPLAE